jgi:hypothetical protein
MQEGLVEKTAGREPHSKTEFGCGPAIMTRYENTSNL